MVADRFEEGSGLGGIDVGCAGSGGGGDDDGEAFGVGIGGGAEEDGVKDAEDGGVDADAEGERGDDGDGDGRADGEPGEREHPAAHPPIVSARGPAHVGNPVAGSHIDDPHGR